MIGPFRIALVAALSIQLTCTAYSAEYPDKPIRIIVPYAPGGGADVATRVVAQKLTERWKQQVVVDNRAGANGNIGCELASRAPADGYTLVMGTAGPITMNVWLYPKLAFDPVKDFAPVVLVAPTSYLLVVQPALPANSVKELIDFAKANPGKVTFASPGVGGPPHLAVELMKTLSGVNLVHVPYKGAGPAMTDLLAGQVSFMFADVIAVQPYIQARRLRALAVSTANRNSRLPGVPTVAESGVPAFDVLGWSGLLAPAATPRGIISKVNSGMKEILTVPDVQEKLASDGREFGNNTPAEFAAFIRAELEKWRKVVSASGVKVE